MNPTEAVSSVFRNYVNFRGRARRSEFWWFTLFSFISQAVLGWIPLIGGIYSLALVLPSLAVTVRRLHDTNQTAWWLLFQIIPALVGIVLAALLVWVWASSFVSGHLIDQEVSEGFLTFLIPAFLIWTLIATAFFILMFVVLALPGTSGLNRYGPDPLQPDPGAAPGHPSSPPGTGQDEWQYCPRCGAEVQPDARFCAACGANV